MDELQNRVDGAEFMTMVNMRPRLHLIRVALGYKKFTALRTKFSLFEYMLMRFGLTYVPATSQREIDRIL